VIAAYVSGHGFGHSTRVAEVLRELRRREPGYPLAVVTSAPAELYGFPELEGLVFRQQECDVGLAQHGALVIDTTATIARWRDFTADWPRRVEAEAEWLRTIGARLVLGDIPPLAFAAAARAGLPSVAMANFSWDWIYRHLARREPALEDGARWAAEGYGQAGRLLRLPFYGDMPAFRTVEDVPLVARQPTRPRDESRRALELTSQPTVVLSFGGLGLRGFDPQVLAALPEYVFITTHDLGTLPANVRVVSSSTLGRLGLGYIDLVAAADVVVTKPGYGIVSDCIGAGTRVVYTDRDDFPEYPILVEQMSRWLPAAFVTQQDLADGRLSAALRDVLGCAVPPPPDCTGAQVVAARLLDLSREAHHEHAGA
jgi:UDP:flavonoid glycosyltransferase YjiC (YdhE family)